MNKVVEAVLAAHPDDLTVDVVKAVKALAYIGEFRQLDEKIKAIIENDNIKLNQRVSLKLCSMYRGFGASMTMRERNDLLDPRRRYNDTAIAIQLGKCGIGLDVHSGNIEAIIDFINQVCKDLTSMTWLAKEDALLLLEEHHHHRDDVQLLFSKLIGIKA